MKTATLVVVAMLTFGAIGTGAQGPAATSCGADSDGVIGEWRDRIGDFWDVRMRIVDDGSTLVLPTLAIATSSTSAEISISMMATGSSARRRKCGRDNRSRAELQDEEHSDAMRGRVRC